MKKNRFGKFIKDRRKELGISQKETASQLGLKQSTYSNYENGYTVMPGNIIDKLSDILEVDLNAKKSEYVDTFDRIEEREMFLNGYDNETEQLLFFEELADFRHFIDNILDKRTRREVADLFSQILDLYLNLVHAGSDEPQQELDRLNQKFMEKLNEVRTGT